MVKLITVCLFVTLWLAMACTTWAGVTYLSH